MTTQSMTAGNYSHLLPPSWKSQISVWLAEDTPSFDYGGFVVGEALREAFLWGKGSNRAVLAGTPFVDEIFRLLECTYVRPFISRLKFLVVNLLQSRMACGGRRGVRTSQAHCHCAWQGPIFAPWRAHSSEFTRSMQRNRYCVSCNQPPSFVDLQRFSDLSAPRTWPQVMASVGSSLARAKLLPVCHPAS